MRTHFILGAFFVRCMGTALRPSHYVTTGDNFFESFDLPPLPASRALTRPSYSTCKCTLFFSTKDHRRKYPRIRCGVCYSRGFRFPCLPLCFKRALFCFITFALRADENRKSFISFEGLEWSICVYTKEAELVWKVSLLVQGVDGRICI
jgi:hypothetical protein